MIRLSPRLVPIVCALALTAEPTVLAAQTPPEAGTRVRVTRADGEVLVGDFVRATRDTLWVVPADAAAHAPIPVPEVELLETRQDFSVAVLGVTTLAIGLAGGVMGLATRNEA